MRRICLALGLMLLLAQPARAQLVVIDPANLIQAVLIAERTLAEYQTLLAQYRTIQQMAQGLGTSMEGYRIPAIPITRHDLARWEYGGPWLAGLNTGDPTGAAYYQTTRVLERPNAGLQSLPAAARRDIEQAYATIEITDSVAEMGGHQVALIRQQSDRLQTAVDALQGDVLNGLTRYHEMTVNLDKIAAAELLARRQDMSANELLSHTLEQLLARGKRLRDTEAVVMNMRLRSLLDTGRGSSSVMQGAADDMRSWRQP
jgi:hypothetical protein